MVAEPLQGLTMMLGRAKAGDEQRARGELIALNYEELRRVASGLMRRERSRIGRSNVSAFVRPTFDLIQLPPPPLA